MADETYRQERRPLRSEVQQPTPNPVPESAESIPTPQDFQRAVQNMGAQGDGGLNISGLQNAPPEILEKMQKQGIKTPGAPKQQPQDTYYSPEQRMAGAGSSKLKELLEGTKDTTHIYEKIELPSLGKFYDGEDGPTDGVIHIRPMTGEEEQILATSRFIKKGTAVNMIFNRCMQENYNSEEFLSADRTFLLIWLRGISYSADYDVEVTCPFTDKRFSETVDLNLDVTLCPRDYGVNNLVGVLPRTGYNFRYRLARGSDEQKIQEYRDRRSKFDTTGQADDTLLYRTALLIEEIEGLTNKDELLILLKKLPIQDVAHLRNVTSDPPFGVDTKVTLTSPFTQEEFDIDLPLEANFFFPRQRKGLTQV
jgi:hypothetical protein